MAMSPLQGRQAAAGRTRGFVHFFPYLCSPCSGRRRNSILPYAPNHLAFSPQRFPTATILPRHLGSTQVGYIYLHSSSIRHILLDISETLTPSNPPYPCSIHSTTDDNEATAAPHRAISHLSAAPGRKPPPRRTGQEATAAQHRARSHRRAGSHRRAVS